MSEYNPPDHAAHSDLKPPANIETLFDDFLGRFEEKINDPDLDHNDVVRDTLYQIYLGTIPDFTRLSDYTFPIAARALLASFDPRNVTLEAEYYSDLERDLYYARKPLIWFWYMFDRSPLGLNFYLGTRIREILAPHIFESVGEDFRCSEMVQLTVGYNLSVGDNVSIGRHAVLDDRGALVIGNHVGVSDFVTLYSHAPDVSTAQSVNKARTIIGNHVRIGFHATILPGVQVGDGAVVGPTSVVTRNVDAHHVLTGAPAEVVSVKPKNQSSPSA